MNDDIRTRLNQIVDAAMQDATPTEPLRMAAIESVRAKRRRRPAVVVGAVLAGLALTGTGAYAIHVATGSEDRVVIPDRIGDGLVPPPETGTSTTEASQDDGAGDETTQTPAPTVLATADPNASFPQCGAMVTTSAETEPIRLGGSTRPPTASGVELYSSNQSGEWLWGIRSDATLALVRDGVVVGATTPASAPSIPFELGQMYPAHLLDHFSSVLYASCSQPGETGTFPPGRYTIWGSQDFVITERAPFLWDGTHGSPVAAHEELTTQAKVADLWIDEEGQPVLTPDTAAGWPSPIDLVSAIGGDYRTLAVVWLASDTSETEEAAFQETLLPLGYLESTIPFGCQPDAPAQLGLVDARPGVSFDYLGGVGVIFATRSEAEAFVERYEPMHGPALGIVDAPMWCGE